jgi:hypothetical protein
MARCNTAAVFKGNSVRILCAVDMYLDREKILDETEKLFPGIQSQGFPFIAAFPEIVPQTNMIDSFWQGLLTLAAPSGLVIVGLSSGEAERFDRKKPKDFSRLGDIRKKGFRALAYRKSL